MGDLCRNKNEVQEGTLWGLGVPPVAWACVVHRVSGCRVERPQSLTSAHRSLDHSRGRLGLLHSSLETWGTKTGSNISLYIQNHPQTLISCLSFST